MSDIRSFSAVHYGANFNGDVSALIAPPFDVLDAAQRGALQARHPNNIVTVDLPHIPPKAAGPADVYEKSATALRAWLAAGILVKEQRTAFYPYAQTYDHGGRAVRRRGFFALVRLSPFGAGRVVPHEKTYKGAIEDRFALMKATGAQLSPIFGLFNDRQNEVTNLLYANLGRPFLSGTLDGVKNDLWKISDPEMEVKIQDLLAHKPVYIADGHHRYTTALEYQKWATEQNGGPLPPNHPANFCMFVLISMNDPGLLIQATHRLIGGLGGFDVAAFRKAVGNNMDVLETDVAPDAVGRWIANELPKRPPHTMGLYDGVARKLHVLRLVNQDVLKALEPNQSEAWRKLDVAVLQRYLLDEVVQPTFAGGKEITRSYVSDPAQMVPSTDGVKSQVAFILQPTPLVALEELGRHNEVMPPKSTYFFPKLATGMLVNQLR